MSTWQTMEPKHLSRCCSAKIQVRKYAADEMRPKSSIFRCAECYKQAVVPFTVPIGLCTCCTKGEEKQEPATSTPTNSHTDAEPFEQWAILEVMGHRRLAGKVSEAKFPAGYIRIDVPAVGEEPAFTSFYNRDSVFALHPTSEEAARAVANQCRGEPIQRYEVRELIEAAKDSDPIDVDDNDWH